MVRVRYLAPGETPPPRERLVMVRRRRVGEGGHGLRGNNLAGNEQVWFLAPHSGAGLTDAIARASHYADGCRIDEVFVRDAAAPEADG